MTKPFRFMGRDPVSKHITTSELDEGSIDKSEWRHIPTKDGKALCGEAMASTPKAVGIEKKCSACMKVVYQQVYGSDRGY